MVEALISICVYESLCHSLKPFNMMFYVDSYQFQTVLKLYSALDTRPEIIFFIHLPAQHAKLNHFS